MKKTLVSLVAIALLLAGCSPEMGEKSQTVEKTPSSYEQADATQTETHNAPSEDNATVNGLTAVPSVYADAYDSYASSIQIKAHTAGQTEDIVVETVERAELSTAAYRKVGSENTYIGFIDEGIGGRIPFAGPDEVWAVNKYATEAKQVYASKAGTFFDVSPDETLIAYASYAHDLPTLVVENIDSKEIIAEFSAPSTGITLGNALFSPDGMRIAYAGFEALIDGEKGYIYEGNLTLETVETIDSSDTHGLYIAGWSDNNAIDIRQDAQSPFMSTNLNADRPYMQMEETGIGYILENTSARTEEPTVFIPPNDDASSYALDANIVESPNQEMVAYAIWEDIEYVVYVASLDNTNARVIARQQFPEGGGELRPETLSWVSDTIVQYKEAGITCDDPCENLEDSYGKEMTYQVQAFTGDSTIVHTKRLAE